MLVDLMITLSVLMILMGILVSHQYRSFQEKETYVGLLAVQTKLQAIRDAQKRALIISDGRIQGRDINIPFDDCELVFTKHGTASISGSCDGENHPLTLKPGEGGIGYPWE